MSRKLPPNDPVDNVNDPSVLPIKNHAKRQKNNQAQSTAYNTNTTESITPKLRASNPAKATPLSSISLSSQRLFSSRSIKQKNWVEGSLPGQRVANPLSLSAARHVPASSSSSSHRPHHSQNPRRSHNHSVSSHSSSHHSSKMIKNGEDDGAVSSSSNNQGYINEIDSLHQYHHDQHSNYGLLNDQRYRHDDVSRRKDHHAEFESGDDIEIAPGRLQSHIQPKPHSTSTRNELDADKDQMSPSGRSNQPRRNFHTIVSVQPKAITSVQKQPPQQPPQQHHHTHYHPPPRGEQPIPQKHRQQTEPAEVKVIHHNRNESHSVTTPPKPHKPITYQSLYKPITDKSEKELINDTNNSKTTTLEKKPEPLHAPSLIQLAELYATNYERDPFSLSYCNAILNNSVTPPIILLPDNQSIKEHIHNHDHTRFQSDETPAHDDKQQPLHISFTPTASYYDGNYLIESSSPLKPLLVCNPVSYQSGQISTPTRHQSIHNQPAPRYNLYICASFSLHQPQFTRIPIAHYLLSSYKQSISFNSEEILTLFDTSNIEQRLLPPYQCIMSYLLRICDYFRLRFDVFMNSMECLMYLIKDKVLNQWEEAQRQSQPSSSGNIDVSNQSIHQLPTQHNSHHAHHPTTFSFASPQLISPVSAKGRSSRWSKTPPNHHLTRNNPTNPSQPPTQQSYGPLSDEDYIIITQRDIIIAVVFSSKFYDNRYDKFTTFKFLNTFSFFLKNSTGSHQQQPSTNRSLITTASGSSHHSMLSKDNFNHSKTKRTQLSTHSLFTRFFLDYLPGLDLYLPLLPHQNSNSSSNNIGSLPNSPLPSHRFLSPASNNDPLVLPFLTQYGLLQHELNLLHLASLKTSRDNDNDDEDQEGNPRSTGQSSSKQSSVKKKGSLRQSNQDNSNQDLAINGSIHRPTGMLNSINPKLQGQGSKIQPFSSKSLFYSELSLFSTLIYNVSFLHSSNYMTILDSLLLIVVNYLDIYDLLNWVLYTIFGSVMIPQQLKATESLQLNPSTAPTSTITATSTNTLQPTTIYQKQAPQEHADQFGAAPHQHQHQHPSLPARLRFFLQKQFDSCPDLFFPSQPPFGSNQPDHGPNHKPDNVSTTKPININLNPNLRHKQVITILRLLCEILIKILVMTQPITFQFRWPSDVLCGAIVSSIIHLFPLDTTTLDVSLKQNETQQQQQQHNPATPNNNANPSTAHSNPIQFNSSYHIEIDKRIQQQLLFFSSAKLNPRSPVTTNELPIQPNPFASFSYQNQVQSASVTGNSLLSGSTSFEHKVRLMERWENCAYTIWLEAFAPWLMTDNSNNIGYSGGINPFLSYSSRVNEGKSSYTDGLNDYGVIKPNISAFSSMSFYQINLTSLYKTKQQQMLRYHEDLVKEPGERPQSPALLHSYHEVSRDKSLFDFDPSATRFEDRTNVGQHTTTPLQPLYSGSYCGSGGSRGLPSDSTTPYTNLPIYNMAPRSTQTPSKIGSDPTYSDSQWSGSNHNSHYTLNQNTHYHNNDAPDDLFRAAGHQPRQESHNPQQYPILDHFDDNFSTDATSPMNENANSNHYYLANNDRRADLDCYNPHSLPINYHDPNSRSIHGHSDHIHNPTTTSHLAQSFQFDPRTNHASSFLQDERNNLSDPLQPLPFCDTQYYSNRTPASSDHGHNEMTQPHFAPPHQPFQPSYNSNSTSFQPHFQSQYANQVYFDPNDLQPFE